MNNKITIIDAIMGSGKTYDAIQRMKKMQENGEKFIYVTPFLPEIDRIIEAIPEVVAPFSEYTSAGITRKRDSFLSMVDDGLNIATTHALFSTLLAEDYSIFKDHILILDEVINPVELLELSIEDTELLIHSHLMDIDPDTGKASFSDFYTKGKFLEFKRLCDNGTVYLFDQYFLIWAFPPIIFKSFKEIEVMTYLFKGSILKAYFMLHNIKFSYSKKDSSSIKEGIRSLLTVYKGKANKHGEAINSFSVSWIRNCQSTKSKQIATSATNVVKYAFKTPSRTNAYTTFDAHKRKLGGASYSKNFIPVNARSTNDYRDNISMVYLANRYLNPITTRYFIKKDMHIHQDYWALGELLQWLWRGCIRDNKPMNVYIPSSRMRGLLLDWLDDKDY